MVENLPTKLQTQMFSLANSTVYRFYIILQKIGENMSKFISWGQHSSDTKTRQRYHEEEHPADQRSSAVEAARGGPRPPGGGGGQCRGRRQHTARSSTQEGNKTLPSQGSSPSSVTPATQIGRVGRPQNAEAMCCPPPTQTDTWRRSAFSHGDAVTEQTSLTHEGKPRKNLDPPSELMVKAEFFQDWGKARISTCRTPFQDYAGSFERGLRARKWSKHRDERRPKAVSPQGWHVCRHRKSHGICKQIST